MPVPATPPRPLEVVVVENHESTLAGIAELCAAHPEELRLAGGHTSLDALDLDGPAPDVVVLDLLLGRDDVLSTPAIPRLRDWPAKVLVHTSEEKPVVLRAAVLAGANGVALKNDGLGALLGALRDLREGTHTVSSALALALLEDASLAAALTAREVEVLQGVDDGLSHKQIAARLGIAQHTVKSHVDNACAKYRRIGRPVTNTVSVVRQARSDGWLDG
ncbi:hypothetical protein ASG49_13035 [Marmoricola sp. Leaf446]|uniref:response regulator transcription factor n=1 Tax=Marmoricola sp. Leaf446 TaxID=1736379 RepID=UPI0006F7A558|nr:response regulator transcription factor [Marmoricola sp. Leaf446]KQT90681.1 hypothetical protein ASG49_13035 [Marmoricola sp. Leaf446]